MKTECRKWARICEAYQRSKITRHTSAPLKIFTPPSKRFEHVHLDIVILPMSEGYRYCLTCIDRFQRARRWPEAIPMENQEAETVASILQWISRFGVSLRITTDQGRQFESLFRQLSVLTGSKHLHTMAYHPQANGLVERFHRQLKAAIRCYDNNRWTELPTILLGIRAAWREDLGTTAAELVYGETLRLPGQFLNDQPTGLTDNPAHLIIILRHQFDRLRPVKGLTNHDAKRPFIFKDLATATHVFVRHDGPKTILQPPYDGPFQVIKRTDETIRVQIHEKKIDVSIDRVKPAYLLAEPQEVVQETSTPEPKKTAGPIPTTTRTGRRVRFPDRFQAGL